MSETTTTIIPAQPGSFVIVIWEDGTANALPVAAWMTIAEFRDYGWFCHATPLVSDSMTADTGDLESLDGYHAEWKAFMPGENALAWVEKWEKDTGRKISRWDLSNWWPSKSPVFATAGDTLWSDGLVPPERRIASRVTAWRGRQAIAGASFIPATRFRPCTSVWTSLRNCWAA